MRSRVHAGARRVASAVLGRARAGIQPPPGTDAGLAVSSPSEPRADGRQRKEPAADAIAEPTVSGVARRRESRAAYFRLIGRTPRLPFEKHDENATGGRLPSKERYRIGGKSPSFAEKASAHLFG